MLLRARISLATVLACTWLMTEAWSQVPILEEVMVTGTRIQRTGMAMPTPVTSISSDELDLLGPGQMVEAVSAMPQFLDNHLPADGGAFNTDAGQSFLNLRGIGSSRMLVLLDGRRAVSAGQQGGVNINAFPEAAIQRVEVVTGGASAAYGSDAVAGVVNFIIDRDYTGFEVDLQGGMTSRRDAENYEISVVGGFDLGSRGHLLLSGDHFHADGTFGWDKREWFRDYAEVRNPNPGGPADITAPDVRSTLYTYGGLIPSGPLAGTQFLSDGSPAAFARGPIQDPPFAQVGGDGVNPLRDNELYPEQTRNSIFTLFDYELTDNVTAYVQGTYGRSIADYRVSELRLYSPFGTQATIFRDNAYLPPSIQAAMDGAGIASFQFHRMSSFADWTDIEGTSNTARSFTAGFDAEYDDWRIDGYVQYGRNKRLLEPQQPRLDLLYQALDAVIDPATGRIVCNSTLTNPNDGCVPLNLFGHGQMTNESRDYLIQRHSGYTTTRQRFAEVSAARDLFDGREAGPISIATGVSYREESIFAEADPIATANMPTFSEIAYRGLPVRQSGAPFVFQHANMLATSGGYDVKEIFAETLLPLVTGSRVAESLNVNVAARYADYEGTGSVWAWKAGSDWQITEGVRLRATRSRDIRAANLGERFDRTITSPSYDDPWTGVEHTPAERTVSGGNPEVGPEQSDTSTFGLVFQPPGVTGLSVSIDWFDVRIADAIDQIGAQLIIDLCFDQGSFCQLLKQDPVTNEVLRVDNIFVNIAEAAVNGVDFEVGYNRQLGDGAQIALRLFGAYLNEHSFTDQFGVKLDRAGETGDSSLPEWQGVLTAVYNNGPFSLSVTERYIGSGKRDVREIEGVHIDDNSVDSALYTNLRFAYDIDTFGGRAQVFANVENLFDKDPPLAPSGFSFFSGTDQTNAALFDRLGRRYTVGVQFEF